MRPHTLLVLFGLLYATPSTAAVTPLSVQRVVRVDAEFKKLPDGPLQEDAGERTSVEYGAFDNAIQVKVGSVSGRASQTSSVSPQQVSVVGSGRASVISFPLETTGGAFAASTLHYEFSVDVDTPYVIDGYVQGVGLFGVKNPFAIDTRVTLRSADQVMFHVTSQTVTEAELIAAGAVSFHEVGTLSPGVYTLDSIAEQDLLIATDKTQDGSYSFTLTFVPEPTSLACTLVVTLPLIVPSCRRMVRRRQLTVL